MKDEWRVGETPNTQTPPMEDDSVHRHPADLRGQSLRLITWNVGGLRMRQRMEEIVPALNCLMADVFFLQETHLVNERQRSRAQRLWKPGPSFWSYDPEEKRAGVAVLFRSRDDMIIDEVKEEVPGRLLVVDVTLKGWVGGREEARPFRLCGLYAPVAEKRRRAFWDRLREVCPRVGKDRRGTGNKRCLIILGDFNNRSRMADRSAYVAAPERPATNDDGWGDEAAERTTAPPPLLPDERELEVFLAEGLGLRDVAMERARRVSPEDSLEFFPMSCRRAYEGVYCRPGAFVPTSGKEKGEKDGGATLPPYTYYHTLFASRIDRVRAPSCVRTDGCAVIVTPWSNHGMLKATLGVGEVTPRGPPRLWRLRPEAMEKNECRTLIETTLACLLTLKRAGLYGKEAEEEAGALAWWDRVKREVRRRCRKQEQAAYDCETRRYHEAVYRFLQCHARVARGLPCDPVVLERARDTIANHQRRKGWARRTDKAYRTRGPLVAPDEWAKAREGGGSGGGNRTPAMQGLRNSENDPVSGQPNEILRIMEAYYGEIFAEKEIRERSRREFLDDAGGCAVPRRLNAEDARSLLGPVTETEVSEAIRGARRRSAPGPDGLGWAFYKRFRGWLAEPLAEVFSECLARDRTNATFGEGTLIFLPKPGIGDRTLPQNWRPIVLTNVDYRILAKVLNGRLARVASRLVVRTQTSAIPNRRMLDSLCALREFFQRLRRRKRWRDGGDRESMLLLLDQRKAFDNVHHAFLWEVLRRKGVPSEFVQYVRLLYRDAAVVAQWSTGHRSENKIHVRSGVRQGCPMSPLLYVLCLDTLLSRLEHGLVGVSFETSGGERLRERGRHHRALKLVAHADDVALLVRDEGELSWVRRLLDAFEAASGARVNLDKSYVVTFELHPAEEENVLRKEPLTQRLRRMGGSGATRKRGGGKRKRTAGDEEGELEEDGREIEDEDEDEGGVPEAGLKLLGMFFSVRKDGWHKNWHDWVDRVREKVTRWKRWRSEGLGLYQRTVYVRTYLMPQAAQLAAVYPAPERLVREVEGTLFQFLWGAKTFPLARAVAYRPVSHGGLAFPAVGATFLAAFLAHNFGRWAQREQNERGPLHRGKEGAEGAEREAEDEEETREGNQRPFWMEGFQRGWRRTLWARRWWDEEGRGGRIVVTAADKTLGPDYLVDVYGAVREWKVQASVLKTPLMGEKGEGGKANFAHLKRTLYWGMLEARLFAPHEEKERSRMGRPQYLRDLTYPIETFQDRRVPFRLWETRWRAFHLVLNVQGCRPWLRNTEQACVRIRCQKESVAYGRETQRETVAHAVSECPAARCLWREVARALEWPDLLEQQWESIVSGREPPEGVRGPRKRERQRGTSSLKPGEAELEARRKMPPPPLPPKGKKRQATANRENTNRENTNRETEMTTQDNGGESGEKGRKAVGGTQGMGVTEGIWHRGVAGEGERIGTGPTEQGRTVGTGGKHDSCWTVPWPTVRLVNLYVLLALAFQRRWELKSRVECDVERSAKVVCRQLNEQWQRDKERLPPQEWRRRWPWKGDNLPTPIT